MFENMSNLTFDFSAYINGLQSNPLKIVPLY